MARPIAAVDDALERRVRDLGYEVVDVEWAGSDRRPILRIRIDHVEPELVGDGVTVDDCVEVSKGLEPWLDALESVPDAYTLEVSSPGVERPLTRAKDFVRFAGHEIAVKGPEVLAGRATYLEGELIGLKEEEDGSGTILLRLPGGDEVAIPRREISGARLIFRWEQGGT